MFEGVRSGIDILKDSMRMLVRQKILLAPLLFSWFLFLLIAGFLRVFLENAALHIVLRYFLVTIFLSSLIMSFSFVLLLELIGQWLKGGEFNLLRAFKKAVFWDFFIALPYALVWAFLWVIITILETVIGGKQNKDAVTSVISNPFRLLGLRTLLRIVFKTVRIIMFMSFPAIVWEGKKFFSPLKRSAEILHHNFVEILVGYVVTGIAGFLLSGVPLLIYWVVGKFLDSVTTLSVTMFYFMAAWGLLVYLEQIFVANIFISHIKKEKSRLIKPAGPTLLEKSKGVLK